MAKVTRTTMIMDLLKMDEGTAAILMKAGMHCIGCVASAGENIEQACMVHGIDPDKIVKELNDYLENKENE